VWAHQLHCTSTPPITGGRFGLTISDTESALVEAHRRTDKLLLNVLPPSVAERLKTEPPSAIAEAYDEVSILFADLVGFTAMSARISAAETVALLNKIYSEFDEICRKERAERIKTIGDGYMVVCGAPT
jgi:adenylate cyclase